MWLNKKAKRKITTGSVIKCADNTGFTMSFTLNKEYEIIDLVNDYDVYIINDKGNKCLIVNKVNIGSGLNFI